MKRRLLFGFAVTAILMASASTALAAVIDVHTGSYYYDDSTPGDGQITAKVGDQLRFLIEDSGKGTPHTIEVDELGIHSGPLATNSVYTTLVCV